MRNPFTEESLDTRDIMVEEAAKSVRLAEELGVQQYQVFDEERPVNCSKPLSDPIKKNKLQLFGQPPARVKSKSKLQSLQSLFSRLCIVCQSQDGDLHGFFRHENQSCPRSGWHLRMASYDRTRSQIFLIASLAVLNVAVAWSSSMVLHLLICWSQLIPRYLMTTQQRSSCHILKSSWSEQTGRI